MVYTRLESRSRWRRSAFVWYLLECWGGVKCEGGGTNLVTLVLVGLEPGAGGEEGEDCYVAAASCLGEAREGIGLYKC